MYPIDLLKVRPMMAWLEGKHSQYADSHAGDQSFTRRHLHGPDKRGFYNRKDGRLWINVARCDKRHRRCWYVFITNISPQT